MAEYEQEITPLSAIPLEPVSLPAHLQGETHAITVWENKEAVHITLEREQEIVRLTVRKDGPHVVFEYGKATPQAISSVQARPAERIVPATPTTAERAASPECPPVTIEGYIGRIPSFNREKETERLVYKFPLSYRPDPKQWDHVVWYNVIAYDAVAEKYNQNGFARGKAVRIEGTNHTHMETPKKGGPAKQIREIHAEEITVIKGKPQPNDEVNKQLRL